MSARHYLLPIAAACLPLAACGPKATGQSVAVVNGEEISVAELNAELATANVPASADRKAVMFVTHDLEEAISLADRVVIMSAGPNARIIGDYPIAIPRPRDISEIKLDPRFLAAHREIWHALKEEVLKGYRQSNGGA